MTAPTRLLILVSLLLTRIITAQMDLGVAATSSSRSRCYLNLYREKLLLKGWNTP